MNTTFNKIFQEAKKRRLEIKKKNTVNDKQYTNNPVFLY